MRKAIQFKLLSCVLATGLLMTSHSAWAQSPQTTVLQLNQQAMDAYGNLRISQAIEFLQEAEKICKQSGISGSALARTYVNLGIVEAAGNQNNAAAMTYFKQGICLDPSVALDPLSSTPELETLFKMAHSQVRAPGACDSVVSTGASADPGQPPVDGYSTSVAPVQNELLRHQPVVQQKRLVPIPIFVEINPNVQVAKVVLFYRTLGERIFQQLSMERHGRGYAATIGCDVLQTFDPRAIEYYIAVFDPSGELLGTAGTEAQPNKVTIVKTLTVQPPALPDGAPPAKCEEECPPWNPDCNEDCGQLGDLCEEDSECCGDMSCDGGVCSSESGRGSVDTLVRFAVNAGTGAGLVTSGTANSSETGQVSPGALEYGTAFAWAKFHARFHVFFNLTSDFLLGANYRMDMPLDSGFEGGVAHAGTVNLGYRVVGDNSSVFELFTVLGLGAGQLTHRIPYEDCLPYEVDPGHPLAGTGASVSCNAEALEQNEDGDYVWNRVDDVQEEAFFRKAGLFVVEAGLESYVWFGEHFGLNVGVLADMLVGDNFALNFDLQLGLATRF